MDAIENLRAELRDYLVEAKPLDRPSTMADPKGVAEYAAKRVGYLGFGNAQLLAQASYVENPQQAAKVLVDCLAALPQPKPDLGSGELLTVEQAAARMNISPRTVYRLADSGELAHVRIGRAIRISPDAITDYRECQQQQGESLFR